MQCSCLELEERESQGNKEAEKLLRVGRRERKN